MNQEEMLVLFTQTSLLQLVSGHHPSVPSMTLFPSPLPLKLLKVSEGRFPLECTLSEPQMGQQGLPGGKGRTLSAVGF